MHHQAYTLENLVLKLRFCPQLHLGSQPLEVSKMTKLVVCNLFAYNGGGVGESGRGERGECSVK